MCLTFTEVGREPFSTTYQRPGHDFDPGRAGNNFMQKLNQPLILGYMLAGFLASPHFSLLPNVIDSDNITVWSDIGVIFILFDLGLDYNFNKIKSTANTAIIAAVTEFTGIACLGFACAQLLGWSLTDSIFTGCMLTMSSTAVVSKTLGELNLLKQAFAPIAFGILVLEDISGIIMMVVLSTVAAAGSAISPLSMLESIGLLVFFLIICFIIGIYFLPTFFQKKRASISTTKHCLSFRSAYA